jgi:hypothetical protein
MAEKTKSDFDDWFKNHICYLPGDTWPEAWLLQKGSDNLDALAALLNVDSESLSDQIEYALQAGKHNEFHDLGRQLGLDRNQCIQHFTAVLCQPDGDTEIAEILKKIRDTIEQ